MSQTHEGGPSSHKEWTACLHPGRGILNAGNLLLDLKIRSPHSGLFRAVRAFV